MKKKFKYSFESEKKTLGANSDATLGKTYNKDFDKTKYINPNINKILTHNIIKSINNNIDFKLMEFYNYDKITKF